MFFLFYKRFISNILYARLFEHDVSFSFIFWSHILFYSKLLLTSCCSTILVIVLQLVSSIVTTNISLSFLQFMFATYFWQAVCDNYNCTVDSFHSLVDGKAIWCLLDYYFQKELHNVCSLKVFNFFRFLLGADNNFLFVCKIYFSILLQEVYEKGGKTSIMSVNEYSDALYNFILSQKLIMLLGNFPEVNFNSNVVLIETRYCCLTDVLYK